MQLSAVLALALSVASVVAAPLTPKDATSLSAAEAAPLTTVNKRETTANIARSPAPQRPSYNPPLTNPDGFPIDACADKSQYDHAVISNLGGHYYEVHCDSRIAEAQILHFSTGLTNEQCTHQCDGTTGCLGVNWALDHCELLAGNYLMSMPGATAYVQTWIDNDKREVNATDASAVGPIDNKIAPTIYHHLPAGPLGTPIDPCLDAARFEGGGYQLPGGQTYSLICNSIFVAENWVKLGPKDGETTVINEDCLAFCDGIDDCLGFHMLLPASTDCTIILGHFTQVQYAYGYSRYAWQRGSRIPRDVSKGIESVAAREASYCPGQDYAEITDASGTSWEVRCDFDITNAQDVGDGASMTADECMTACHTTTDCIFASLHADGTCGVYIFTDPSAPFDSVTASGAVSFQLVEKYLPPANAQTSALSRRTTYTGDITHFEVGLGSCGVISHDNEWVVALPHGMMNNGPNPNTNPLCGQHITIQYAGQKHRAPIKDTCAGCDGQAIDLSPSLFKAVAPNGDGRVHGVQWWFS